jgi:hypothetical protein
MNAVSTDRIARATLGWLGEPGDPQLQELLAAHGPVATVDILSRAGVPFTLRAEIRHLPGSRLWQAAAAAIDEAQHGGSRVVIPARSRLAGRAARPRRRRAGMPVGARTHNDPGADDLRDHRRLPRQHQLRQPRRRRPRRAARCP